MIRATIMRANGVDDVNHHIIVMPIHVCMNQETGGVACVPEYNIPRYDRLGIVEHTDYWDRSHDESTVWSAIVEDTVYLPVWGPRVCAIMQTCCTPWCEHVCRLVGTNPSHRDLVHGRIHLEYYKRIRSHVSNQQSRFPCRCTRAIPFSEPRWPGTVRPVLYRRCAPLSGADPTNIVVSWYDIICSVDHCLRHENPCW